MPTLMLMSTLILEDIEPSQEEECNNESLEEKVYSCFKNM